MNLSDPIRRALRTFLDAALGTFLTLITLPQFVTTVGDQPVPKLSALASLLVATAMSGLIAVLNFAKNYLEDSTGKAFLVPKANPDPEPTQPPKEGDVAAPIVPWATQGGKEFDERGPLEDDESLVVESLPVTPVPQFELVDDVEDPDYWSMTKQELVAEIKARGWPATTRQTKQQLIAQLEAQEHRAG